MAFEGWILKFGTVELPVTLIAPASYDVEVKRTVLDSYEDENNLSHYEIHEKTHTTVTLSTKMGLHQKDIEEIQTVISAGLLDAVEGKYKVTYWDPSKSEYRTMQVKLGDVKYPFRKVDPGRKDIIYDSFAIELKEY